MPKINFFSLFCVICVFFSSNGWSFVKAASCTVLGYQAPSTGVYHGPIFCDHKKMKQLSVIGPADLRHSLVVGKMKVSGQINAKDSVIGELIVEDTGEQEHVMLTRTKVNGNIIFLGKKGLIYLDRSSIFKGKAINGEVNVVMEPTKYIK